jgi:hypothetical protein
MWNAEEEEWRWNESSIKVREEDRQEGQKGQRGTKGTKRDKRDKTE